MEQDHDHEEYRGPQYRRPELIDSSQLRTGLQSLVLFASDPNLCQQALNLGLIDEFAMRLEYELLRKQFEDEPVLPEAAFLNALSQMWIFAAYELMRTWRQRTNDVIKWSESGGLQTKLAHLRKLASYVHFGREIRARQLEQVIAEPALVARIRCDLRRSHMLFVRMEAIRVSIAKHEVRGRPKSVALMPTYGRINRWCGSLDYELAHDSVSMGTISRRDLADDLRAIPENTEPSDEDIRSFDEFMHGPSSEEIEQFFASEPPKER